MRRAIRYTKVGLIAEAVAVPIILLYLAPHWPKTFPGWVLVVLVGPPLWLLGEFFLSWVGGMAPYDSVTSMVLGIVLLLLLVGAYILFSTLLGTFCDHISIEGAPLAN